MGSGRPSVLQHGLVALEHTLRHLGSSALQGDLRRRWEVRGQRSQGSEKHFSHPSLLKYFPLTDEDSRPNLRKKQTVHIPSIINPPFASAMVASYPQRF